MELQDKLRHFAWIVAGYIAAACLAGFLAAIAFYIVISPPTSEIAGVPFSAYLVFGIYLSALAAAIPAFSFIAVCEWRKWRDWRAYTGAGAATGVSGPMLVLFGFNIHRTELLTLLFGLCIGALCGFVYWRLAGRNAGAWRAH